MEYKYKLSGLDCANCTQKIEDRLNQEEHIENCTISFATGIMTFNSEQDGIEKRVSEIISQMEPEVTMQNMSCNCQNHDHSHVHQHHDDDCDCGHHHHDDHCHCGHHHDHPAMPVRNIDGGIKLHIHGLDCANCALKVENEIKKQPFIEDAVINFSTETLVVKTTDSHDLVDKIQKAVDSVEEGVIVSLKKSEVKYTKPKLFVFKDNIELMEGIIIFVGAMMTSGWFSVFLYIFAYLLIGYKVILKALKNLGRKDFLDENFLMCLATFGAIALQDYGEAIAVMMFYAIGEIFQGYAVNKTRNSISSLMNVKSDYANLQLEDEMIQVPPEDVQVGQTVVVKVGEKVPLDGVVIQGSSMLDTSSLTGESVPRLVETGDEILSGVVNLNEILYVKVTHPYEDSTVSRIIDLVENSASKKAQIEKFITRFARVYTPAVVFLAVLLLIVPMIALPDQSFYTWLYRACTFLVVSCPCALVISIPLGLYAGLGKASSAGILIKGGNYLELLKDVDTVVFDKTGTLTKGEFEVVEISDDSLLEIGAYGEFMSNHPIAKSIVKAFGKDIDSQRIADFKETAGMGINATVNGHQVSIGNRRLMSSMNLSLPPVKQKGTLVYVALDHQYLGFIVISDCLKPTSADAIRQLKAAGIKKTVLLSGDNEAVVKQIGTELCIDEVHGALLPADKVEKVETYLEQAYGNDKVVFVGDGINDAPVLSRADIGIAMGGLGSDAAIEAADIVLMDDDPSKIALAMRISKKTLQIVHQNIAFALFVKLVCLILGAFGIANMWLAIFADVGVMVIAVMNAMRCLKI